MPNTSECLESSSHCARTAASKLPTTRSKSIQTTSALSLFPCSSSTSSTSAPSSTLAAASACKAALSSSIHTHTARIMHFNVQQMSLLITLLVVASFCAISVESSPALLQKQQQLQLRQQQQSTARVQQCREGCFEKFATKEILCRQNPECLTCWDECAILPPPKINKSIRETWSLHTVSMLQQDSLVLVDVAWAPLSTPNQCLVTWEVAGGGLMGNLLTESFNVQLSLWPDTKYRVQVTCKNKLVGTMSRSLPLIIDTAEAITPQENNEQQLHRQSSSAPAVEQSPSSSPTSSSSGSDSGALSANKLPSNDKINELSNSVDDAANSAEQLDNLAAVLPYEDDQSAEAINKHTNFIFNWHAKNSDISDISAIEPIHKPDLNVLTTVMLTGMQKPLLFGVVSGTLLLMLIMLVYVCMLRHQRLHSDKAALIEDDIHAVVVSMPPSHVAAATTSMATPVSIYREDIVCKNAAICSRNALKV